MKLKPFLIAAALAAFAVPSFAAVGVSVNIGQPGFYGQINIGDFPQPRVIYEQPVTVYSDIVDEQPIYLRVPPGHEKHWSKHCRRYNACGRRVYFVRDDWYRDEYVPRYREQHGERDDHGDHGGRGGEQGDRGGRGDDHGRGHGDDHGRGGDRGGDGDHGHGHGRDKHD